MNRLKGLLGWLRWLRNKGVTLTAEQAAGGEVRGLLVTCLHRPGCWSYCTGGYRYCLCCNRVRIRC